jgi:hypothetical protein
MVLLKPAKESKQAKQTSKQANQQIGCESQTGVNSG